MISVAVAKFTPDSSTARKNAKRRAKRKARIEESKASERNTRQKTAVSSLLSTSYIIPVSDASKDDFTARKMPRLSESYPQTLDLVGAEYSVHKWDGRHVPCLHLRPPLTAKVGRARLSQTPEEWPMSTLQAVHFLASTPR